MKPMRLTSVGTPQLPKLLTSHGHAFFPKLDGVRCLVEIDLPDTITAFSRNGQKRSLPPNLLKAFHKIRLSPTGNLVFDGELMDDDTLYLFDIPQANFGPIDITNKTPFGVRYTVLQTLCSKVWVKDDIKLLKEVISPKERLALVEKTLAREAEGIVIRDIFAPYEQNKRSVSALKWKARKTVDCVVMATKWQNRANLVLGCYDENGFLVEVGRVSALYADGPKTKVGDVVQVTCSHLTPDGRLREPVTPIIRNDKNRAECTMDQMVTFDMRKALPN